MVLLVLEVPPEDSNLGSQEDGDSQLENIMSSLEGQGACFFLFRQPHTTEAVLHTRVVERTSYAFPHSDCTLRSKALLYPKFYRQNILGL